MPIRVRLDMFCRSCSRRTAASALGRLLVLCHSLHDKAPNISSVHKFYVIDAFARSLHLRARFRAGINSNNCFPPTRACNSAFEPIPRTGFLTHHLMRRLPCRPRGLTPGEVVTTSLLHRDCPVPLPIQFHLHTSEDDRHRTHVSWASCRGTACLTISGLQVRRTSR
jgi:hypothetical protein